MGNIHPWGFSGKSTGEDCHFLLQGIFPTQGSNPSLLHWQADSLLELLRGSQAPRRAVCGTRVDPWVGKIPWRRKWQPTPVFLPGELHGQRSLACYSPWGHKESDMTERPGRINQVSAPRGSLVESWGHATEIQIGDLQGLRRSHSPGHPQTATNPTRVLASRAEQKELEGRHREPGSADVLPFYPASWKLLPGCVR